MQFRPFEQGIEVYGASIDAILEGFSLFPTIALEKLVRHGIGEMRKSAGGSKPEINVDRSRWYAQASWLSAFEDIATAVGSQVLFKIGSQVPKHAPFPASITDIFSGLSSIDVAYHMNHRKGGRVMFDPESGKMLEGIGHYSCAKGAEARRIIMRCKNPYPCDFDRGVVQAVAAKFEPQSAVTHDKAGPCRKKGQDECIYQVTW